ncbi:MAG TPA: helix-turn-helix domain-containing protein [Bacteroidia bacterium]|nr:helix-turn-helix domain-containing protein [Bacteroidia bacterium]
MSTQTVLTLINPQNGNLAFKVFSFDNGSYFDHIQRLNYHSLIVITEGSAKLKADFSEFNITKNSLLCFSPYQPFMLTDAENLKGISINFHSDFFCIYKHHQEIACNGVLFNNIYQPPYILLTEAKLKEFNLLIEQMKAEMQNVALAQHELLISYLKIFLITASRIKVEQNSDIQKKVEIGSEPFILQNLKDAIEEHYRTKHSASDYADLLNISANALAKISKNHFNKTLTDLISERIIVEAKRELYLTSKAVKTIAYELGFDDEHYFSRFFKNNTNISPKLYRDTVGFAKAET